jgi:hypothetical protein
MKLQRTSHVPKLGNGIDFAYNVFPSYFLGNIDFVYLEEESGVSKYPADIK